MVQTNIKIGYDSEIENERDYNFGGPCRPFVELSMACGPHFQIFPGKKIRMVRISRPVLYTHAV